MGKKRRRRKRGGGKIGTSMNISRINKNKIMYISRMYAEKECPNNKFLYAISIENYQMFYSITQFL